MKTKTKIKMNIMKEEKGLSLIEMLITASVFLVVLAGVYTMVFHYADVSRTEQSRRRMQQESRFLTSHFASELKNAGSTLAYYGTRFCTWGEPYFNGIYPLNSTSYDLYPDGIIIAAGDPDAVTCLAQDYTPRDETIYVENTDVEIYNPDDPYDTPPWRPGDKGIILDRKGYYVFSVTEVPGDGTLIVRSIPVYYSGLLLTRPDLEKQKLYQDVVYWDKKKGEEDEEMKMGDKLKYLKEPAPGDISRKTPVIRLDYFAIYLFREVEYPRYDISSIRKIRQLVRVTDAKDYSDVLSEDIPVEKSIISENIWDMQITYTVYPEFGADVTPDTSVDPTNYYFAGAGSSTSTEDLMDYIRQRKFKKLNLTIVSLSDEFSGKGKVRHRVPAIGDQYWYYLPPGKYSMKMLSLEIEPRNYNISQY
jgi:prepilin-type N-terminal cleavage/methylation domain-containing protein